MTAEIGHLALWLALYCSLGQVLAGGLGVVRKQGHLMALAPAFALTQLALVALAFALLTLAFLDNDFSLAYVANNSNSLLPGHYKIAAVWGAHEGSFLLWILIMSLWTSAVALDRRLSSVDFKTKMLVVMGILSSGFLLFSLLTSSPFSRLLPFPPLEGADLNPQLQDFGLIVHPPMLYFGYVGFSVPFAFAIAVLWSGRSEQSLFRWIRPWTNVAWALLGLGIVLGSWWAYYELGWGGWWFWDAVENASFIPWLTGTALIHSLAVSEKRGLLSNWTLLLAILAFSFSLLGAFLVRSGVLISVHSFASDPERGIFMLAFLSLVVGGSLALYFLKLPKAGSGDYAFWSRETFLVTNNYLLVVAAATVLLGTLFPLFYEVLSDGQKLSVGPPYFNITFLPVMAILALALSIGPLLRWRRTPLQPLLGQLFRLMLISVVAGMLLPLLIIPEFHWRLTLLFILMLWLIGGLSLLLWGPKLLRPQKVSAGWLGMFIAHAGFLMCIGGVGLSSILSETQNLLLEPKQEGIVAGYRFRLEGVRQVRGANYLSDMGVLTVQPPPFLGWLNRDFIELTPEKRYYPVRGNIMTEAAIDPGFWRDLYVALGEPVGKGWSMQVHYKPFIRWIWLGGIMMVLGGIISAFNHIYQQKTSNT